jgi:hypothetical protein
MKNIIFTLFFINILSALDNNSTSLDMFLFKIGFKAVASELNSQKEISNNNTKRIKLLEIKIKKLLDINKKQKNKNFLFLNNGKLNQEKINKIKFKIALVGTETAQIYANHSKKKPIRTMYKYDIIKIEYCGKFGWCKMHNEKAFIQKYRLKF